MNLIFQNNVNKKKNLINVLSVFLFHLSDILLPIKKEKT